MLKGFCFGSKIDLMQSYNKNFNEKNRYQNTLLSTLKNVDG